MVEFTPGQSPVERMGSETPGEVLRRACQVAEMLQKFILSLAVCRKPPLVSGLPMKLETGAQSWQYGVVDSTVASVTWDMPPWRLRPSREACEHGVFLASNSIVPSIVSRPSHRLGTRRPSRCWTRSDTPWSPQRAVVTAVWRWYPAVHDIGFGPTQISKLSAASFLAAVCQVRYSDSRSPTERLLL